ncbi:uncharacterized protein LOC127878968 isoform X2 [Dreissena polymorpha]|uniref:uncharacterized protein LOC127878968 isoform X2 n=1 Tax=Dreissena polymorpha TaxID=45954 RepID=UPI002263E96C|nr:uncharacterized protein LOC127878968 isoform X2 [Dreissena polymorpha]
MTTGLIIVLYLTSLIPGAPAPHGPTIFCKTCNSVNDPAKCHVTASCREGYCAMEVYNLHGVRTYKLSCKEHVSCENHHLIGKRFLSSLGILECKECCHYTGCEKHLCQHYPPVTTTHRPTTTHLPTTTHNPTSTTPKPTFAITTNPETSTLGRVDITVSMGTAFTLGTSGSGACVDIEDSHFQCSYWKALGYCAPDTVPGYQVSLLQCRKTCDLCDV